MGVICNFKINDFAPCEDFFKKELDPWAVIRDSKTSFRYGILFFNEILPKFQSIICDLIIPHMTHILIFNRSQLKNCCF